MTGLKEIRQAWDSCVFLAWFKQEEDKPLEHLASMIKQVEKSEVQLVVSVLCATEVLDKAGVHSCGASFRDFVKHESVMLVDVDMRVAERVAKIRQRLIQAIDSAEIKKGLKAPDAVMVATALIYRASVLYTFDPDLLALSESHLVDGLRIEKPCQPEDPSGQKSLFDGPH